MRALAGASQNQASDAPGWYLLQWRPGSDEVQDEFMGIFFSLWEGGCPRQPVGEKEGSKAKGPSAWAAAITGSPSLPSVVVWLWPSRPDHQLSLHLRFCMLKRGQWFYLTGFFKSEINHMFRFSEQRLAHHEAL